MVSMCCCAAAVWLLGLFLEACSIRKAPPPPTSSLGGTHYFCCDRTQDDLSLITASDLFIQQLKPMRSLGKGLCHLSWIVEKWDKRLWEWQKHSARISDIFVSKDRNKGWLFSLHCPTFIDKGQTQNALEGSFKSKILINQQNKRPPWWQFGAPNTNLRLPEEGNRLRWAVLQPIVLINRSWREPSAAQAPVGSPGIVLVAGFVVLSLPPTLSHQLPWESKLPFYF